MGGRKWTTPGIGARHWVSQKVLAPMEANISGEVAASRAGIPIGVVKDDAYVTQVIFSVSSAGVGTEGSAFPSGEVDVKVNNTTSIFSTKPRIGAVSGESAQQKTTLSSAGDTGIIQPAYHATSGELSAGDVLTWDFDYNGDATPDTKMQNPTIMVELEPKIDRT